MDVRSAEDSTYSLRVRPILSSEETPKGSKKKRRKSNPQPKCARGFEKTLRKFEPSAENPEAKKIETSRNESNP